MARGLEGPPAIIMVLSLVITKCLIKCLPYFHVLEVQHPLKVLERQTQSLENQFFLSDFEKSKHIS